ncbi:Histidinol-phosphate aminotransferase (EC [Olavius algarvensis associated proteobacterium Delta 3]|nr:Histidinol-phosphate aminotransferase (EC [Olavius algarvensis associated proteobacterium Delta 3]CAB5120020.1 Histidinol-phosphate aminotransferase (EC [Olavius algarvensis associated proteobacterium Delta 3]
MFRLLVPHHIQNIDPYVTGKPLEEVEREYGIADSVKLASNENPLGPSPKAMAAIEVAVSRLNRYPDGAAHELTRRLSLHLDIPVASLIFGNGSDELIGLLSMALLQPGDEAIIPQPTFLMYEIAVRATGATPVFLPLRDMAIDLDAILGRVTPETRMVFICNPNNPTGTIVEAHSFRSFLEALPPSVAVVVDEAYAEFVRDAAYARGMAFLPEHRNLAVLRTFSKAYGLAGLRIGYGVMAPELAELLHRIRPPFNASSLAQAGALGALSDQEFLQKTVKLVHDGMDELYAALGDRGVRYIPSQANFFLIDVGQSADVVFEKMLRLGVIVRSMTSYGYPEFIRINAGLPEENQRFLKALDTIRTE